MELAVIIGKKGKHVKVRWKRRCEWSLALGNGYQLLAPALFLAHLWLTLATNILLWGLVSP